MLLRPVIPSGTRGEIPSPRVSMCFLLLPLSPPPPSLSSSSLSPPPLSLSLSFCFSPLSSCEANRLCSGGSTACRSCSCRLGYSAVAWAVMARLLSPPSPRSTRRPDDSWLCQLLNIVLASAVGLCRRHALPVATVPCSFPKASASRDTLP